MTTNTKSSRLSNVLLANPDINHASVNDNVLATILNDRVQWLAEQKQNMPLASFKGELKKADRSFYNSLKAGKTRFILECKKASPSKGVIREDYHPAKIAKIYDNYAAAISVLTENKYFQGDYKYLAEVRKVTHVPILCKDFIFDEYQIYLARYYGADAVLLMLSVLTDEAYLKLRDIAFNLGMDVLTESSTEEEIARALDNDAQIMGINNRNLRTLSTDLDNVRTLGQKIPDGHLLISESGINTHDQVLELSQYVKGFLVGSSLTAEDDIDFACRRLIFGENKVCGITKAEDAVACYHAGALYNGFIFVEKSRRFISPPMAKHIINYARSAGCNQKFVGVFADASIPDIIDIVNYVGLNVVQLHGQEDTPYIKTLRRALPAHCQIWKAIGVHLTYPEEEVQRYLTIVDKIVLDTKTENGFGGTGKTFNWEMIADNKARLIVAGGLTPDNVAYAHFLAKTSGLDLNSGLEDAPGIKDHMKINVAFANIKDY